MRHKLMIDVDGDEVIVTGPRDVVKNSVDLSLLNYIEVDGFIRAQLFDQVPGRGAQAATAAVYQARGRA